MCFSATANFVGGPLVGAVGVATPAQVRRPREVVLTSLPLLFAVHQFTEGFVWLGLQGQVSTGVGSAAAYFHVLYAQGVLPALMPLVGLFAVVYVVAVVGAALVSGYCWIVAFGIANLIGLTATQLLLASSFTSIWCAYAAIVSVMILFFLRRRRQDRHELLTTDDHAGVP